MPAGHELSRSLPADAHLADVRPVGSGAGRPGGRSSSGSASASASTARTTRRTTRRSPSRDSPTLRDSNPSVVVDSRARAVRVRQGQARSADHDRVLRQRHPRDGRRERAARRRRQHRRGTVAAGAAARAGEAVQDLSQLRRAAAARSVPHRVLGARGSQAAADAAGAGVQPQESPSSSAAAAASAAKSRCRSRSAAATSSSRTRTSPAPRRRAQEAAKLSNGEMVTSRALDLTSRDDHRRRAPRRRSCQFGGVDIVVNTAAIYPTPDPSAPAEDGVGEDAADQRDLELRAGAGGGEGAEGAEAAGVDRAHQLGERGRAEDRQRGVRRQQGGDQPPDPRAGDRPRARWCA